MELRQPLGCPLAEIAPLSSRDLYLANPVLSEQSNVSACIYSHALCCFQDEHGDPFYYNISDDTVQWDPPVVLMAGIVPEIQEDDDDEALTPTKKKKKKKSE